MIGFEAKYTNMFLSEDPLKKYASQIEKAIVQVRDRSGAGNDFLGWTEPGKGIDTARIKAAAARIREMADVFVVIGIGGSFMGAKCAIDFLNGPFHEEIDAPKIYFAGNNISPDALGRLLALCEDKSVCVNVVSKSGTTTEPAIAFRMFRALLERKYGKDAAKRIFVTTDARRGALRPLAEKEGYEAFVVPDDIGGRYSVLTDVGLLPIAVAGGDIDALLQGAKDAMSRYLSTDVSQNEAAVYAACRHALYEEKGMTVEVLTGYEPELFTMSLWWQQLYGESHGKEGKGIFPVALTYTQDLHSMGQYLQEGTRNNFETVMWIDTPEKDLTLCAGDPADGLAYLEGKSLQYINSKAYEGVIKAHIDGGVPNLLINIPDRSEHTLGELFTFFEVGCAIGGYMLNVNPFDQPGVEAYKSNMFELLGKPKN